MVFRSSTEGWLSCWTCSHLTHVQGTVHPTGYFFKFDGHISLISIEQLAYPIQTTGYVLFVYFSERCGGFCFCSWPCWCSSAPWMCGISWGQLWSFYGPGSRSQSGMWQPSRPSLAESRPTTSTCATWTMHDTSASVTLPAFHSTFATVCSRHCERSELQWSWRRRPSATVGLCV